MNNCNRIVAAGALTAILAGLLPSAEAATVSATASITDLSTTLLSLSHDEYLSDASTPLNSGFDASSTLQSYFFNEGNSFASIDNSFAPLPMTQAGANIDGNGHASVLWTFDWTATGTGTARIDLEYLYNATVLNWQAGETGVSRSYVSLLLDGTSNQTDALHFFYNTNDTSGGFANLALNFDVTSGQRGTFTVSVASDAIAVAPVPLPAAAWLLGSGLLGLGGFARRRRSPQ